jgi:hypothetical protein
MCPKYGKIARQAARIVVVSQREPSSQFVISKNKPLVSVDAGLPAFRQRERDTMRFVWLIGLAGLLAGCGNQYANIGPLYVQPEINQTYVQFTSLAPECRHVTPTESRSSCPAAKARMHKDDR